MGYSDISQALKDIATAGKKLHDQEINTKIIDLQGMVMDLMLENQDLKQQLNSLNGVEERKSKLKKYGMFWVKDEETLSVLEKESSPLPDKLTANIYCPRCLAKDNKFVSVDNFQYYGDWKLKCPVCNFWAKNQSY